MGPFIIYLWAVGTFSEALMCILLFEITSNAVSYHKLFKKGHQ